MNGPFRVPVIIFNPDDNKPSLDNITFICNYDKETRPVDVVFETCRVRLEERGYTTSQWTGEQAYHQHKLYFSDGVKEVLVVFKNKDVWECIYPTYIPILYDYIGDGKTVSHLIVKIDSLN